MANNEGITHDDKSSVKRKYNKKIQKVKETPDSDKYKIALKLVNCILVNIGKNTINDLVDFKEIDREDIIKDINKESMYKMENEIFLLFDRTNVGYYRKTKYVTLNWLRGILKEIGYKLTKSNVERTEIINDKRYKVLYTFYQIK